MATSNIVEPFREPKSPESANGFSCAYKRCRHDEASVAPKRADDDDVDNGGGGRVGAEADWKVELVPQHVLASHGLEDRVSAVIGEFDRKLALGDDGGMEVATKKVGREGYALTELKDWR